MQVNYVKGFAFCSQRSAGDLGVYCNLVLKLLRFESPIRADSSATLFPVFSVSFKFHRNGFLSVNVAGGTVIRH